MLHLAQYFAVAIDAFAIMSNHFHLIVFFDPQESDRWRDEEVAERWLRVFPPGKTDMSESDQVALFGLHCEFFYHPSTCYMPERRWVHCRCS
jgi:hypothetical protein